MCLVSFILHVHVLNHVKKKNSNQCGNTTQGKIPEPQITTVVDLPNDLISVNFDQNFWGKL